MELGNSPPGLLGGTGASVIAAVGPHMITPPVERRRRDKINNWIVQLSKIIPDCNADNSKTGAVSAHSAPMARPITEATTGLGIEPPNTNHPHPRPQSKGGILSKACDYIRELRQTNQRMQETFKEAERLQMDNELLRQQVGVMAWNWEGRPECQPPKALGASPSPPCPLSCPPDRGAEERECPASSPAAAAQPGDGGRRHPAVTPAPPASVAPAPALSTERDTCPSPSCVFYSRFLTKTGKNNAFLWIHCPPPSPTWK